MLCTVTLGIVVKCVRGTTLPDLQASALDLQYIIPWKPDAYRKGSIHVLKFNLYCFHSPDRTQLDRA